MDLRYEFDEILRQYGYPVLLVRQGRRIRCSCWDEKRQEADRTCPVCFGLGYVPIVEKHTIREQENSVPESMGLLAKEGVFGGMAVPSRLYYMRHDVKVRPGDLLVDVDWNTQGQPVYGYAGIYEVSHVDPQRFERGQLIFYNVYCKDEPVEKQIRGIRIVESSGILNYEIAAEGGLFG